MQRSLQSGSGKPVADRAGVNARLTAAATAEHDSSIATEEQQQQQLIRLASPPATVTAACASHCTMASGDVGQLSQRPSARVSSPGRITAAKPATRELCLAGSKMMTWTSWGSM